MDTIFFEDKNAAGRSLAYVTDPDHEISYQKEMMEKVLMDHLAEPDFSEESICFHLPADVLENGIDPADLISLLKELLHLLEQTDDAFLDRERWLWDPAYWTWDAENRRLKGIYLPDHRFVMDLAGFFMRFAMQMIYRSLREEWTDTEKILLVHRFYIAAVRIEKQEMELEDYIQKEEARQAMIVSVPAVRSSQTPPLFQSRKKGSVFEKIRRIFSKQSDSLPLPFS